MEDDVRVVTLKDRLHLGLVDDVPDDVKRQRNQELLRLQEGIALRANRELIGQTVEVLVEGFSKRAIKRQEAEQTRGQEVSAAETGQLVGRTRTDGAIPAGSVAERVPST